MGTTTKKTQETVIRDLTTKFPHLNFSNFTYTNQLTPSSILCKEHGERQRSYKDLMRSVHGCDLCSGTGEKARKTTESVIRSLEELYGPEVLVKYDLSRLSYVNARTPLDIGCPEHGQVTPTYNELQSRKAKTPCKHCNVASRIQDQEDSLESFLVKAENVHPGLDSYESTVYQGSKVDIQITCLVNPLHGSYAKRPNDYLQGQRCPKCSLGGTSRPEKEVLEFICSLEGVNFVSENLRFRNGMKPDIVLPEFDLVIEYHGLRWHSEEHTGKRGCLTKLEYFNSIGMSLIQIFEDEWLTNRDLVKSRLINKLGFGERLFARNTSVHQIPTHESKKFLDQFHTQGGTHNASYSYGLFLDEDLVSVATFSTPRSKSDQLPGFYELIRFASKVSVVGGFSKLLKAFVKEVDPERIISYADRRWGEGEVYGKAGFKLVKQTDPGYFWCKSQTRYSRWNFQKHRLKDLIEFKSIYSDDLTEDQMCRKAGYFKVYDCGNNRWEWSS